MPRAGVANRGMTSALTTPVSVGMLAHSPAVDASSPRAPRMVGSQAIIPWLNMKAASVITSIVRTRSTRSSGADYDAGSRPSQSPNRAARSSAPTAVNRGM